MIWATVRSQSCVCWLYRAFPSLAPSWLKNIINLILVFICLISIFIYFLVRCLFRSFFFSFLIGLFSYCWDLRALCIFWIQSLTNYFHKYFLPGSTCLFILLRVSFAKHTFLILMKSNFLMFILWIMFLLLNLKSYFQRKVTYFFTYFIF